MRGIVSPGLIVFGVGKTLKILLLFSLKEMPLMATGLALGLRMVNGSWAGIEEKAWMGLGGVRTGAIA